MKKILIPILAAMLVAPVAAVSVPMEKESKSTTPVVAAVPAEYYRQMEAEKASRSALRAAVDKHKAKQAKIAKAKKVAAAKKKKAALLAKKKEAARLAVIAWQKAQAEKVAAQKKAEVSQAPKPIQKPVNKVYAGGSAKAYALSQVGAEQFVCLDLLWTKESGWNPTIANASSGAYGIPQALPGSKMASAGSDWQTNPITQINWGLGYIADRYGTSCNAWAHSQSVGWY